MSSSFRVYLQRLQSLHVNDSLAVNQEKALVLISGSSHFDHAELSESQAVFLESIKEGAMEVISMNFPYNSGFSLKTPAFPSIWKASWCNVIYFIHTCWNKRFKQELRRHLLPLFSCEQLIIISQSSGLNLLTSVLENCEWKKKHLKIIALGPVSRKKVSELGVDCLVIKGKKDWYSRFLDRNHPDHFVDATHFGYLSNLQVKEIINAYLKEH